jgi:hypothetical protein
MDLKTALSKGYHLLVVVKKQAFLARPGAVFLGVNAQDAWANVYDLQAMRRIFARNVGSEGRVFPSAEVAILAGISKAALHEWIHDGLVRPTVKFGGDGSGRGRERLWDYEGAFLASVAGCMRRSGVSRDVAKRVMESLRGEIETVGTGEAIACQN